jgi:hypothetical protein
MANEKGHQHHFLDEPDIIFLGMNPLSLWYGKKIPPQKS